MITNEPGRSGPCREASTLLRVDPATVVIFCVLLSPALMLAAELLWMRDSPHAMRDAAILVGSYAAGIYWMCGRTVELLPGKLVQRVFFVRKVFELGTVCRARIVADPGPYLELRHVGERTWLRTFNVKPYSRAGVSAILDHVALCGTNVKLAPIAGELREGRFEAITRETIRARNLLRLAFGVGGGLLGAALVRWLL